MVGSRGLRATTAVALGLAAAAVGFGSPAHAMTYGPGAPSAWVFTACWLSRNSGPKE